MAISRREFFSSVGWTALAAACLSGCNKEIVPDSDAPLPPQTDSEEWSRVRDIVTHPRLRMGIGANVTFYHVPDDLKPLYGSSPKSYHIFLRFRPGKMNH
ncbi:MAG: hypothetical protein L0229_14425 [Blastocatellia bacterium]|nr:hypothetical protein [Blastocatellia bacterium]